MPGTFRPDPEEGNQERVPTQGSNKAAQHGVEGRESDALAMPMMIDEPWFAGMLGGFAQIDCLTRGTTHAVNNQEGSGTEEETAEQADEPVWSVLAAVHADDIECDTDYTDACDEEGQTEEHGLPAVNRHGALHRMVQQHGRRAGLRDAHALCQ